MSLRPGHLDMGASPPRFARSERVLPWLLLAVTLAAVGLVATVWRPWAVPPTAVDTDLDGFSPAVLATVGDYRSPRLAAAALAVLLHLAVPLVVVLSARGRRFVRRVTAGGDDARRAALLAAAVAVLTSLATLPLAAWLRLVHDGRWGFRTQSALGWFGDWLVVSIGTWVATAVGGAVLVVALRRWPRSWPYRLTALAAVVGALAVALHPLVVQPLLLPTSPLPDGAHRDAIVAVLAVAGDPDVPVLVGAASERTTRVNALVTGLGPTTRVVVHDTLLELPPEQVASVVAHELAHHEHADLLRGVAAVPTLALPLLLLLAFVLRRSSVQRRVDARSPADVRLVAVAVAFVAVAEVAVGPLVNHVSRGLEAAADVRAMELTGDPEQLLRTTRVFTVRDLSDPSPAPWVRVLWSSHPSVAERVRQAVVVAEASGTPLPSRAELEADERDEAHPAVARRLAARTDAGDRP